MVAFVTGMLAIVSTNVKADEKPRDASSSSESKKDEPKPKPEGGKPVNGLVLMAELVEAPSIGSFEVRLSLKNVSDKPITVCDYFFNDRVQVQWTGPDGKKLTSNHNNYPGANNPPPGKQDFLVIPPGEVHPVIPTVRFHPDTKKPGPDETPANPDMDHMCLWERSNPAGVGERQVTVSFFNKTVSYPQGRGPGGVPNDFVEVKNVWTGTVTANAVTIKLKKPD